MEACELGISYDMCSDACPQDDREAWDNLSDSDTGTSTTQPKLQPHHSDTFGLKQGRCHTCLSPLFDDETHELPSTSHLSHVGLKLDAPRCKLCLGVAQAFDSLATRLSTLDPEGARGMWRHLQQAVTLTHRRKEKNGDKILKAIEDDLDMEYTALERMLEKCTPPKVASGGINKGKVKSNGSCSEGSRAMDVALGRYKPGPESLTKHFAANQDTGSLTAQLERLNIHDEGHSQR
ncbi:hypothetical protein QBC34DRAFT_387084 [Podospora aff. communis PSN243]|uniref:Uncharacterized protein n=1 Tax=Podospora aff. communis PSN243 TaxID=3040156 RepID=A0AAV9G579_9PEZI|nr:hypothetical protein QBC34DRAFT_387084 [Podospora aff. communis PSN243]